MGKIIVSEMITLDGYFSGLNGEVDWFMWDKDTDRETFEMLNKADCLLLGHETYKVLSGYWPTATEEDPKYIQRINGLKKVVVSKSSHSLDWNADILQASSEEELVIEVINLKRENNILIFGSGSIVSILSNQGLIDEYRLFINPLILRSGRPLFSSTGDKSSLDLTNTKVFGNGVVLLEYATSHTPSNY